MIFETLIPMGPPLHPHFSSSGSPSGLSFATPTWKGRLQCVPEGPAANPHQLLLRACLPGKLARLEPPEYPHPHPLQAAALDGRRRRCTWNARGQSGRSTQHVAKAKGWASMSPRGHSLLEEVNGESRRWSAGSQQALIERLSVCQGKGCREEGASQFLIHSFRKSPWLNCNA